MPDWPLEQEEQLQELGEQLQVLEEPEGLILEEQEWSGLVLEEQEWNEVMEEDLKELEELLKEVLRMRTESVWL